MTVLRITSVGAPLNRPGLLAAALALVRRAVGVGFLSGRVEVDRLDLELVREIAREASSAGVGRDAAVALLGHRGPAGPKLETLIGQLDAAIAASPVPDRELRALLDVYDHETLAALVGTSVASLRRYAAGARAVPDAVAGRVHLVALVTSDLAGSYNEFGLRRWWERPRTALDGRSPREALGRAWDPDGATAGAVAELARALAGAGGAT